MAIKKTKKLNEQTATTTVASGEKFAKVDANGKVTLIGLADLKSALLGQISLALIESNVFVVLHRKTDNLPQMIHPRDWPARQAAGEVADGVAIVEGGKILVIAPTEAASTGLPWSSANVNGGGVMTSDREVALYDWNGKENTASIIAASSSSAVTNTTSYAAGFCNLYSRPNANGQGLTSGKWWLPSVGELMMIHANMAKINHALSLIAGADRLMGGGYWSSTDCSASNAWYFYMGDGGLTSWTGKTTAGKVRPVSTFLR